MKNSKRNIILVLLFASLCFCALFTSCKNKNRFRHGGNSNSHDTAFSAPTWQPTHKKICVVFGYGYNEKNYVQNVLEKLAGKYGIDDDGSAESGLLFPLVFPEDFPANRIARLAALIGERELAGLIVIGAPENTHYAIAGLEDQWSNREKLIPYPVYALFPQDDVAGIEATANFVVDYGIERTSDDTRLEEVVQTQVQDLDEILDRAIEYMLLSRAPLPLDANLSVHVSRIFGDSYDVSRYVDAESGIQSINHFIVKTK